jgi:pectin methylesterase-like acyl-CoA thioesterase
MKTLKTLSLTLALGLMASSAIAQPAPLLSFTNQVRFKGVRYATIDAALQDAVGADVGTRAQVQIGAGRYTNNNTLFIASVRNVDIVGAGTNWTFVYSANVVSTDGGAFNLGDNSTLSDMTIIAYTTNSIVATVGNSGAGASTSSTNVFLNRIVHRADSDNVYVASGISGPVGVNWVISNNFFFSRYDGIALQSLVGSFGRIAVYDSEFISRGPSIFTGPNEVTSARTVGTNNILMFKNCTFRTQGSTNRLFNVFNDSGKVFFDNCRFQLGTNNIARDPAIGAFTVFQTNALARTWFRNCNGPATNTVQGQGVFFYNDPIIFSEVWPAREGP